MRTGSSRDDGDPVIKGKMARSSSSSSTSASSFDPLLLDMDADEEDVHDITKSRQDSPRSPRAGIVISPEVSAQWSMVSASPRAGPGPMSSPENSSQNVLNAPPKQSPPVQTMGRPGAGYDPNRIPSSIFASKSTTPMEWSVASNESLFSIHMGNNSFSRDHAILFAKSGELPKSDELSNFASNQQPVTQAKLHDELNNTPPSLPIVIEVAPDNHKNSASMGENSAVKEAESATPKVVMKETAEDRSNESMPPAEGVHFSNSASNVSDGREMAPADGARTSASTPRLSDESGNSSSSFAFPVLGEAGRSGSVKVAPDSLQTKPPEKHQSQPQAEEVTPKVNETRWFSCFAGFTCFSGFSCCPLRCC